MTSAYPTIEGVNEASKRRLAYWARHLRSPHTDEEASILNMIMARFRESGGWNPQLSKDIGF